MTVTGSSPEGTRPSTPGSRASSLSFVAHLGAVQRDANQVFFWLLIAQWVLAMVLALSFSPYAWAGRTRTVHTHVLMAVFLGALLDALPLALIRLRPAARITPHVVAVAQMLWSALLIDVTGGRLETHFHIFGSLAFLAFYRNSGVLMSATAVTLLDHIVRGLFWPDSVYGTKNPEWWRFLEHGAWVSFEVAVLAVGIRRTHREMKLLARQSAELAETAANVELLVEQRTHELAENVSRYRALVENTNAIPWELDPTSGRLLYMAPQATAFYGVESGDFSATLFESLVHRDDHARVMGSIQAAFAGKQLDGGAIDYRMFKGNGKLMHVRTVLAPLEPGQPLRGMTIDNSHQVKLESELRQAQKLESVGKLAAGVAHEINTPVQFVSDSLHFVQSGAADLLGLLTRYEAANDTGEVERYASEIDLPYLRQKLPRAIELALEGLDRVTGIVRSMKEFAYPHAAEMVEVDLNRAIQSTLTIARAEYKYVAELETDYGTLPRIRCQVGDINQVVLNLVVNAAHAIGARGAETKGMIRVATELDGDHVLISVRDDGGGIPEALRERIFDPFFTTKDVGSGTGQGLAIARTIVVERHHGTLRFESQLGVGTTFFVRIPIAGARDVRAPAA